MPKIITGHVVPGDPRPLPRKWITNEPYGPPIKQTPTPQPTQGPPKKGLGEEQHHEVMGQLQKILVAQKSTQIQEALPGFRDWR